MILSASNPDAAATAPTRPPIKACEELLGIPYHQVSKFQIIAAIKAASITLAFTIEADLTISPPIVLATPVLRSAPQKFSTADNRMATLGLIARVDTVVAIALAVS